MNGYTPSPKRDQPTHVAFDLPGWLTDAEAKEIVERMVKAIADQKKIQVKHMWTRRYDPKYGGPVFYIP